MKMPTNGNIREALNKGKEMLRDAGIDAPAVDAGVLLSFAVNKDKAFLYAHGEYELNAREWAEYIEYIGRRAKGEPLRYITGRQEFMSLDFIVAPGVFVPRRETELLVEAALEYFNASRENKTPRMLDIGAGSGCIAVSVAYYLPECRVFALDISAKALEIARLNAVKMGVADRVFFIESDLFAGLHAKKPDFLFDAVVSNPPYVRSADIDALQKEVRDFEPREALDGGADGLDFHRAIVKDAPMFLKAGGLLALETGYNQGEAVLELMKERFGGLRLIKDLAGIGRVAAGYLK